MPHFLGSQNWCGPYGKRKLSARASNESRDFNSHLLNQTVEFLLLINQFTKFTMNQNLTAFALLILLPFMLIWVFGAPETTSSTESTEKRTSVLFSGWQYQPPANQYFFPRTDNYYHRIKPEAIVEIVIDPADHEDIPLGSTIVEHSSHTTSIQSHAEYKSSCVKEPGCRWECEPRQDELPPDCDCVCFYTDSKWDTIP